MSGQPDYGLVMAFDTDDPEFVRGFEIGRLYEMAQRCPESFNQPIHVENAEMALRVGEATGRHVSASDMPETDEWLSLCVAAPNTSLRAPASSSPHGGSDRTAGTPCQQPAVSAWHGSHSCRYLTAVVLLLVGKRAISIGLRLCTEPRGPVRVVTR